jgi:hypothetical protein
MTEENMWKTEGKNKARTVERVYNEKLQNVTYLYRTAIVGPWPLYQFLDLLHNR